MAEVSLGILFKGFNLSKFVLYTSLFAFVALLALKLDGDLGLSYAFVFLPLWICHLIVFFGAIVGCASFFIRPPQRNDIIVRNDFVAMILTSIEHIFLVSFEILAFYKMEYDSEDNIHWTLVFLPLFALSIVALAVSVWAMKHEKSFEFEFFYAINVIEFFFVAFKLDQQVTWSWAVVFIPLWVVLSLSAIGVLYSLVLSIVLARSRHLIPSHRRQSCFSSLLHTFLVLPALASLILLTGKLDALQWTETTTAAKFPYKLILGPLWLSIFCNILLCFGHGGGNVWWFAMRRPFCTFLLDTCPCLRQYANISYMMGADRNSSISIVATLEEQERPLRPIVTLTSLEAPD